MINASLDATAAAMTWTLCLVAKHPKVQARLRQEVESRVTEKPTMKIDCAELPFSEMVVHESLRLYPPNWSVDSAGPVTSVFRRPGHRLPDCQQLSRDRSDRKLGMCKSEGALTSPPRGNAVYFFFFSGGRITASMT
jgi:hypothetical protein